LQHPGILFLAEAGKTPRPNATYTQPQQEKARSQEKAPPAARELAPPQQKKTHRAKLQHPCSAELA
jgi:hypothetical protein